MSFFFRLVGLYAKERRLKLNSLDVDECVMEKRLFKKLRRKVKRHDASRDGPFRFRRTNVDFDTSKYAFTIAVKSKGKGYIYSWIANKDEMDATTFEAEIVPVIVPFLTSEPARSTIVLQVGSSPSSTISWEFQQFDPIHRRNSPRQKPVSFYLGGRVLAVALSEDGKSYNPVYDGNPDNLNSKFYIFVDVEETNKNSTGLSIVVGSAAFPGVYLTINTAPDAYPDHPFEFIKTDDFRQPLKCYFQLIGGSTQSYPDGDVLQHGRLYWKGSKDEERISVERSASVTIVCSDAL